MRAEPVLRERSLQDCVLLLVDDEPANLDLLEEFLREDGYRALLRAGSGQEAVTLLREHAPDLVLLDLHMPGLDGFEVLREVQQGAEPGDFVPVLVLTADVSARTRARALSDGAHDFLIKPLDALEVRLRVRNLLRTRLLHYDQRRATVAREHVLSVVAHDLRNPLASISMDAEMLRNLLSAEEQPTQAQAVRRIERAATRMQSLIDDLIEVARLQHGTFSVEPAPVAPAGIFAEAESMLQPLARRRDITLRFHGPEDLPRVCADAGRIVQVLSNLVGNALRFTPAGGSVAVRWSGRAGELVVSVSDTGPGIPYEQLQHLFRPFWHARDRSPGKGLGLGLVISRAILDAHGGRIWIESEPGLGTTAHFSLPFAGAAHTHAPPTSHPLEVIP